MPAMRPFSSAISTFSRVSRFSTQVETDRLYLFSPPRSAIPTSLETYSSSVRVWTSALMRSMCSGISLFLLPTCSNISEASMNRVASSVLLLESTMMHVAMVTPKNRFAGSWMTASTKLLSTRYLRIFCSAPPR